MDDLLIKYILKEVKQEESNQVQQWLAAHADNRARFEKLQAIWRLASQTGWQPAVNTPQALQRLKQTIKTNETAPVKHIWKRVWVAAATLAGIVGIALGAYVWVDSKPANKNQTPVLQPDTILHKSVLTDTIPSKQTDTAPAVKPVKKKLPVKTAPVSTDKPKKKMVPATKPVDVKPVNKKSSPISAKPVDTIAVKKKSPPVSEKPVDVKPVKKSSPPASTKPADTIPVKKKSLRLSSKPLSPVKKYKTAPKPIAPKDSVKDQSIT